MENEKATLKDVIELTPPPEPKPLMEEMLEELRNRDAFKRVLGLVDESGSRQSPRATLGKDLCEALVRLDRKIDDLRREIFTRDGALPKELLRGMRVVRMGTQATVHFDAADAYTVASEVPTATLEHLRHVADALGFAFIPWAFLHDDYKKLRGASKAEDFVETMSPAFTTFVLAPVSAYDLAKRVQVAEDLPVYFGENDNVMQALEMATPILRTMWAAIADGEKKTAALQSAVAQHAMQIGLIEQRAAEERAARLELEARAFRTRDPLAFAVPCGTDVRTSCSRAVIGPCWGDPMEVRVFEACGLPILEPCLVELNTKYPTETDLFIFLNGLRGKQTL